MKKKKVLLLTFGLRDHGSSRVSGLNHFARFRNEFDVTWLPKTGSQKRDTVTAKIVYALTKRFFILRQFLAILFLRFDIVYIQIIFLPELWLKILKAKGTSICYNVDDAIYLGAQDKFDIMMKYADKVTVSTAVMEKYVAKYNKNCCFIYAPVDTDLVTPASIPHDVFSVGWIGSPSTSLFLKDLEPVFRELATQIKFKLVIVGGDLKMEGFNVEFIDWSEENELAILKIIDVGIMPMHDSEIARAKGGYKLFLYMAAGKPIVASPYGIGIQVVRNNITGFLVETDEQWLDAFLKLYNDKALAKHMGENGRKDAEDYYSYNVCSKKLLDFLNS